MSSNELKIVINGSVDKVWQVLFEQYGDIHIHNPTMPSSYYLDDATKGGLNVARHCKFNEKLYVDEKIVGFDVNKSVSIEVTQHNLPMIKTMTASYQLHSLANDKTEVTMTTNNQFSPSFMKYLMRGQLAKALQKHLFGMKYFIETGKTVSMEDYKEVYGSYLPN